MNITYVVAAAQVLFGIVGIVFGWLSGAEGSALILSGIGVFGARVSQPPATIGGVKGVW